MNSYLFFLGQNEPLALAELNSLFPDLKFSPVTKNIVSVDTDSADLETSLNRLGGIVKVAKLVTSYIGEPDQAIVDLIKATAQKNFSISFVSPSTASHTAELSHHVKQHLADQGLKTRFIEANDFLSPLIIRRQKVVEVIVDQTASLIYQTIWVHDFQAWIARDRYKPYITPHSGMLPPKLARIMVNLALGSQNPQSITVLDPFAGTGTVLMEALLVGANAIGSDLSETHVQGALKNLSWLDRQSQSTQPLGVYQVFSSDATHLSEKITQPVDVIVTEPFLGPPSPRDSQIPNIIKGLQKLYLGAFKDWSKFLPKGAKVVIALPQFHYRGRTISTSSFIDAHPQLGYNILASDLIFTRPGAQIERQILILEKS